ncbi:MAG TPA: Xaa-Pro peptidase family protein [Bryobacteraceae bacterium]|nr:Xaa-Pro peptidase family protein [Bryobacteraceae bacterium]
MSPLSAPEINAARVNRLVGLMAEQKWDRLLFYGHAWRKDFFRYLLNVNFSGPYAIAALERSGEIRAVLSHPWDVELLPEGAKACDLPMLNRGSAAVAGLELMDAGLARALGENLVSATSQVEELRRVKEPEEIRALRRAAALADRGYERFAEVIEPGMAEFELVAEVEGFLKSHGAEDNFMLIASGGAEVTGMKPPTERRFQRGDQVTTELTPQVDGYYAQICRTLVLGEPNAKQHEAFSIFKEAQQAAETLLRPGVDTADVARVQNDVFRRRGYGEYTGSKYTRVRGHNLGLHPDENPYVLEDVHYTAKAGMTMIAHPNTYLPLSGYMVLGDTLLVTPGGCERLTLSERKLFQK